MHGTGSPALIRDAAPPAAAARAVHPALSRRFLSRPGFLLARVDQICTALYAEHGAGETLAQAELMLLIDALQPVPQAALARAAGIDTSTTSTILDNVEAAGWIVRRPDPSDARRVTVALSDAAAERVPAMRAAYEALQRELAEPLDGEDVPRMQALLFRLAANPMGPAPLWTPAPADSAAALFESAPSFLCRRALQQFHAQFTAATRGLSLTPRQFSFLFILAVEPGLSQVEIARLYGVDPSTCAVILRNLAARGWVESAPAAEDKRARRYRITPAGSEAMVEGQPLVDRSERLSVRGEPAGEIRWLVGRLQAIVHRFSGRLRFPGTIITA